MLTRLDTAAGRRRLAVLVMAVTVGLLLPGVASAGPPVETEPLVHTVPNPCTGELHEVTQTYLTTIQEREGVTVIAHRVRVTTDDGFVGNGHQQDVIRDGTLTSVLNLRTRNPETGEKVRVHGRIVVDLATGEFLEGSPIPDVRCLGR